MKFEPKDFLREAGNGRTNETYRARERIFSQGDIADAVFFIQKGKVKVAVTSEHGKEAVVAVLDDDEFFGEGCLAGQKTRLATATAMTDCAIMRLEKSTIALALRNEQAISEVFMAHLLSRTLRVESDLVDQLVNSSERRLARALLLLAHFGSDEASDHIIANVTQEMLAEMIGTTRSRVSHFMNKFRKLGLISYNGHIKVHRSLLNLVLHEQPHINA